MSRRTEEYRQYGLRSSAEVRSALLAFTREFVEQASRLAGVERIALLGSLSTDKPYPKDADLLVTTADDLDLAPLARAGRRLQGRAQGLNAGADVFLMSARLEYLGRICTWRECWWRAACDARTCGQRPHLHDDLDAVTLAPALLQEPPVELWPAVLVRCPIPSDVEAELLGPLRDG